MPSIAHSKNNQDAPLVSVVIPVYNTARYLKGCLDAVLDQTMSNFEVICVDDGSMDDSPDILNDYASRDRRVRVLRQQNQHAGVARNNGLALARGEYVIFCDSDDHIEPMALETLYRKAKEDSADICVCGCKQYFERIDLEVEAPSYLRMTRVPHELPFNRFTNEEYIFSFTTIMTHNKMYRTEFLRDHDLEYANTRNGEDVFFSAMALWHADRITVLDRYLVCYRLDRPDSLVATLSESALDPLVAWVEVWKTIGSEPGFPKQSFDNKFVGVVRHTFRNMGSAAGCRRCFEYLRGGILDELQIYEQPGDYYASWINEFVVHLREDDFEGFMAHLLSVASRSLDEEAARKRAANEKLKTVRKEQKRTAAALEKKKEEVERIKNSRGYRLGNELLKPYRALRKAVRGR